MMNNDKKIIEEINENKENEEDIITIVPKGRPRGTKRPDAKKERLKKEAAEKLWKRGILYWKLDSNQKSLYDIYQKTKSNSLTWCVGRQLGKTYLICIIAIEECLQHENIKIAYVLPRQNQSRKLIKARFNEICVDCPKDQRPKFNTQENIFIFPNGSEVHCVGTDSGNIENARGQTFNRVFMDECGFMDSSEFDYYYKSVLFPTMNTSDRRITVMISTPPASAAHTFNKYIKDAEYNGTFTKRTIYDCPRFKGYEIEEMANAVGGKDSIDFQREYLCKLLADTNSLVIPEATEEKMKNIISDWTRPPYYTSYTSGDFGILDWTAFLFAYYDFRNDTIIIEDELVFNGKEYTTIDMADAIKLKEQQLWYNKYPEVRVCDTSWQIIVDFNNLHNLPFIATRKDDKNAQINALRMKVSSGKLKIHPRCKNLIFHLMNATWNKARTKYDKAADGSHFDCLDALIYLIRNINYHKNPYPKDYDNPRGGFVSPKQNQHLTDVQQAFKDIFTVRRKR